MTKCQFAEEIARLWNKGEREEAKVLFMKVQMVLPPKIKEFLKKKMNLYYNLKGVYIYKQP